MKEMPMNAITKAQLLDAAEFADAAYNSPHPAEWSEQMLMADTLYETLKYLGIKVEMSDVNQPEVRCAPPLRGTGDILCHPFVTPKPEAEVKCAFPRCGEARKGNKYIGPHAPCMGLPHKPLLTCHPFVAPVASRLVIMQAELDADIAAAKGEYHATKPSRKPVEEPKYEPWVFTAAQGEDGSVGILIERTGQRIYVDVLPSMQVRCFARDGAVEHPEQIIEAKPLEPSDEDATKTMPVGERYLSRRAVKAAEAAFGPVKIRKAEEPKFSDDQLIAWLREKPHWHGDNEFTATCLYCRAAARLTELIADLAQAQLIHAHCEEESIEMAALSLHNEEGLAQAQAVIAKVREYTMNSKCGPVPVGYKVRSWCAGNEAACADIQAILDGAEKPAESLKGSEPRRRHPYHDCAAHRPGCPVHDQPGTPTACTCPINALNPVDDGAEK
jgi:hypothetical protein